MGTLHTDICEQTKRQTQSPFPGRHRTSATPQPCVCNPHCVLHTEQVLTVTQLRTQIKVKATCTSSQPPLHLACGSCAGDCSTSLLPGSLLSSWWPGNSLSSDLPWTSRPCTTATQLLQGPLLSLPLSLSWPPSSLELSYKGKSESGE